VSFGIVDSSQINEQGNGDAKTAWTRLCERLQPKTSATKIQLKSQFNRNKLKSVDQDPEEWITELELIRQRLKEMNSHMDEDDFLMHILNNLTEEYESVVESSEEKLENDSLDLSDLRRTLRTKYQRMQRYKEHETEEVGMFASQIKTKCRVCGKIGHKGEDCWTLEANKHKKPVRNNAKKNGQGNSEWLAKIKCFNCNKKGHYADKCTEPKRSRKEKSDSNDMAEEAELLFQMTAKKDAETNTKKMNDESIWIGDTGASCHMTNSLEGLTSMTETKQTVTMGDGKTISTAQIGKWTGFAIQRDGSTKPISLNNVAYVPSLCTNLFSITQAMKQGSSLSSKGLIISLSKGETKLSFDRIYDTKLGHVCGIQMRPRQTQESVAYLTQGVKMTYSKAHQVLGHTGEMRTRATSESLGWKIGPTSKVCESCPIAKAKQKNVKKTGSKDEQIVKAGELFGSDITSSKSTSYGGNKFWVLVVDYATKMKWSFFIKKKSDQAQVLLQLAQDIKAKFNITIRRWRMDNAGENKTTEELFNKEQMGVVFEYTARETPQHNGFVERPIASLYGRVRAMLNSALIPKVKREKLWTECANTATKLDNISITKKGDKPPFEKFYGKKTSYENHL
jgi:hypothetical protein